MTTGAEMGFSVLIPARLASTRLPRKPLADLAGAPMVVRVAQRALRSNAARVVVAGDDAEISAACRAHGIDAILTQPDHPTGSDRLAEACDLLGLPDDAVVVNVQGDEPLIDPALIDACADLLAARADCVMSTAAHAIETSQEFLNPNVVKVVLDARHAALYFSRATIPWARDAFAETRHALPADLPIYRHYGLYAYRVHFLRAFPTLARAPIETFEALEQLRALWHGYRIVVDVASGAPAPGVDTEEDLARVRALLGAAGVER